jgi:hypothetical protein
MIKKILITILMLFSLVNGDYLRNINIKVIKNSSNMDYYSTDRIVNNIYNKMNKTKYNIQNFSLNVKCYVSSNGKFRYKLLKESKEGYNNKILIVKKLEELKEISFKDEMESITEFKKDYKYKELVFEMEVSN